jgi:hypothetical protein
MTMAKNTNTVDQARTALENAEAERDRFRTSIESLTAQIEAATDVAVAMPLHTQLETLRLFLLRAEGRITKAKVDLATAEHEADLSRKAALAKTADPVACLAKMVGQAAKVAAAVRTLRETRAELYGLAEGQRSTAAEAGSAQVPIRAAAAVEALALSDAHEPRLLIEVPRTRGDLIVTLLAGFDALAVSTDFEFRKAHSDDDLIKLALEGRLLDRHAAWVEASNRRRADAFAKAEAREVARRVAEEELLRDPASEAKRAAFDAADTAWRTPAELPPVNMPAI